MSVSRMREFSWIDCAISMILNCNMLWSHDLRSGSNFGNGENRSKSKHLIPRIVLQPAWTSYNKQHVWNLHKRKRSDNFSLFLSGLEDKSSAVERWQSTVNSWRLTFDSWELTVYSWQLTVDSWQSTFDSWEFTVVSWQFTVESWLSKVKSWQLVEFRDAERADFCRHS